MGYGAFRLINTQLWHSCQFNILVAVQVEVLLRAHKRQVWFLESTSDKERLVLIFRPANGLDGFKGYFAVLVAVVGKVGVFQGSTR